VRTTTRASSPGTPHRG